MSNEEGELGDLKWWYLTWWYRFHRWDSKLSHGDIFVILRNSLFRNSYYRISPFDYGIRVWKQYHQFIFISSFDYHHLKYKNKLVINLFKPWFHYRTCNPESGQPWMSFRVNDHARSQNRLIFSFYTIPTATRSQPTVKKFRDGHTTKTSI